MPEDVRILIPAASASVTTELLGLVVPDPFGSPAHVTGAEPESPQPAMTMIVISNHIAVDRVMSTLSEQRLPPCPCGETPGGLTQEWARSDRQMGEHEGPHNGELQDPLSHGIQV